MNRFRYLRDPLFLVCLGLYAANRWGFEASAYGGWFRSYFNDLICIPFCVPPMLWAMRRLRLRDHDGPPEAAELIVPLLLWSAVFELWLPSLPSVGVPMTTDHLDILCYTLGALAAALWWRWSYRAPPATSATVANGRVRES